MKKENKKEEKCVVCGGLLATTELAHMPLKCLSGKEPVCQKHLREIIDYLQKRYAKEKLETWEKVGK